MFAKSTQVILIASLLLLLQGCSQNKIENYQRNMPSLTLEEYFVGNTTGHGLIQQRSGKMVRRFAVDIRGSWDGEHGLLEEHFVYDDGEKSKRLWHIKRSDERHFIAKATDVVDYAKGEQLGNAIHMTYVLQIFSKGATSNFDVDEWYYRINDHVVICESTMKKFGYKTGQIITSIVKE